jgi:predicted Rossmann fold flavoprotein
MYKALNSFSCYDSYAFFEELGVPLKIERGNRVFPESDRAADIRNALKKYVVKNGVSIINERVINVKNNPFEVVTDKKTYNADSVIIATGGLSYPLTGSTGDGYIFARNLGHSIKPTEPALVALVGSENVCSSLAGLSLKNISVNFFDDNDNLVYTDFGEMLFTHTGVSGPVILTASSKLGFKDKAYTLSIDLKPAISFEELDKRILSDFSKYNNKDFINSLNDLLPRKIIPHIIKRSGIDERQKVNSITKKERNSLVKTIKSFQIKLHSKAGFEEAIITAGGVLTSEINPGTMESLLVDNLYFAGEIIDIDANTGGYNLQIAYSTGYLAGISCSGGKK